MSEAPFVHYDDTPLYEARLVPEETILQEAQRLVYGDRQAAYGHPYDDYTRTGRMWEAILGLEPGAIPPHIACLMMAAVKISREVNSHNRDNCTDGAGYFACAQRCAERQAEYDHDHSYNGE